MSFNLLESFNQGLQVGESVLAGEKRAETAKLQQAIAEQSSQPGFNPAQSPEFQKLVSLNPQMGGSALDVFNQLSKSRKQAFFDDARKGIKLLEKNDVKGFASLADDRFSTVKRLGGDTKDIESVMQSFNAGDIAGTINQLTQAEQAGIDQGFLSDPDKEKKQGKTAIGRDWGTFQRLIKEDPKKAKQFGRRAGFIRESEQEKSDIKITEAEKKAVAKANISRRQGFIDSGIESANGAANVRRALNLLDETETGGFDNLALKAKQLFGVEGANEGELSNLLGKAVLAQLKPIFGAAFTAREGDALAALEAKFSNSPASNKRLLENALKLIDRAARRGIAAAESQGDEFTANEIREALAFDISEKSTEPENQAQPQSGVFTSPALGRDISEQDISDTLQANPGLTREALMKQLEVQ